MWWQWQRIHFSYPKCGQWTTGLSIKQQKRQRDNLLVLPFYMDCTECWVKHSDSMNQKQTYVLTKKSWTHTSAFTTFVCLLYLDYISCQEIRSSLYPLTCRVWAANWAWGNREAGRSVLHVSHRGVKCVRVCVCVCVCVRVQSCMLCVSSNLLQKEQSLPHNGVCWKHCLVDKSGHINTRIHTRTHTHTHAHTHTHTHTHTESFFVFLEWRLCFCL